MGRKNSLLFAEFIAFLGYFSGILEYEIVMIIGRFISGFVSGINSVVVPVILSENMPKEFRGMVS